MEPLRIDHVGIAVNSLDEMRPFYEALGLKSTGIEEVKEQQVRVEFYPCGDSELELLESTTDRQCPPLRRGRRKHSLHAPQGVRGRAAGAYRKKIKNYRYNIN